MFKVPYAKTGYMDTCACAIYDGQEFYLGLSSSFEYPTAVTKLLHQEGLDVNQAFHRLKLTDKPNLGNFEGAVGLLSKGKLMRKELTKQAVVTALIRFENRKLY